MRHMADREGQGKSSSFGSSSKRPDPEAGLPTRLGGVHASGIRNHDKTKLGMWWFKRRLGMGTLLLHLQFSKRQDRGIGKKASKPAISNKGL